MSFYSILAFLVLWKTRCSEQCKLKQNHEHVLFHQNCCLLSITQNAAFVRGQISVESCQFNVSLLNWCRILSLGSRNLWARGPFAVNSVYSSRPVTVGNVENLPHWWKFKLLCVATPWNCIFLVRGRRVIKKMNRKTIGLAMGNQTCSWELMLVEWANLSPITC